MYDLGQDASSSEEASGSDEGEIEILPEEIERLGSEDDV
jgi:hypothetical protein